MRTITAFVVILWMMYPSHVFSQSGGTILKREFVFQNPPFNECHASTLVEPSPGKLLVAFFAGSGEGNKDVNIWLCRWQNGTWSQPEVVADGVINDTLRYPTWNPVLFKSAAGTLFLFYKVGPSPRQWWGMVRSSADDGNTWTSAQRLPDGILGPVKNKPVQIDDSTILSPSSTETEQRWSVHVERSTDNGQSWQIVPVDDRSTYKVIQPAILSHHGNRLQMLCRSDQDSIVEAWSDDGGQTWGKLSKISVMNPNSGIDAVTLENGPQLLVYNPAPSGAVWFNGRGKLQVAVSDDGRKWNDIAVLENTKEKEYSYPAVIQTQDGNIHITYTYERKNIRHIILAFKR